MSAIDADFATYKPVPTRRVLQIVLEVPLERQGEVFAVLGYPMPGESLPVAVARLETADPESSPAPPSAEGASRPPDSTPAERGGKPRTPWHELTRAQQAGIRCGEERFQMFLRARYPFMQGKSAAEFVRQQCEIASRSQLDTNGPAGTRWDKLDAEYRRWAGLETEPRG